MDVLFAHCAGLDVHKKTVVACRIHRTEQGVRILEKRTFETHTPALLELSDWLAERRITHVAMESTGIYWQPVYNILEGNFTVWVVNAHHIKNVPGRKTDAKDAEWIATCLEHGLVRPSFVPSGDQRDLRELTRARTNFVRERVNLVNRVQKLLEGANIKLASVASDVMGKSGRAMLDALVQGETDATLLAEMSKGRLREKREQLRNALTGLVRPVHRIVLGELLIQIDGIDETLARLDAAIEEALRPFEQAACLLMSVPGISSVLAQTIVGEIGADMSRFPSAAHLCAWAGVAPGNNQSGGRRLSGKKRHGNSILCSALVQAAHAAGKTKTYLAAQLRRLSGRRGKKRALIAVAHSILKACYYMILRNVPYEDLGPAYFDQRRPENATKGLVKRLRSLGYDVTLTPKDQARAA